MNSEEKYVVGQICFNSSQIYPHPVTGASMIKLERNTEFLISAILSSANSEANVTGNASEFPYFATPVYFHDLANHCNNAEVQSMGSFMPYEKLVFGGFLFSKTHEVELQVNPLHSYYKAFIIEFNKL